MGTDSPRDATVQEPSMAGRKEPIGGTESRSKADALDGNRESTTADRHPDRGLRDTPTQRKADMLDRAPSKPEPVARSRGLGMDAADAAKVGELKGRVDQIRATESIAPTRNVAVADAVIDGQKREYDAVSGKAERPGMVSMPANPQFEPYAPPNISRPADAEYKILEQAAADLGGNRNAKGEITIYSERPPCESCVSVAEQFQDRYPGVRVKIYDGGNL